MLIGCVQGKPILSMFTIGVRSVLLLPPSMVCCTEKQPPSRTILKINDTGIIHSVTCRLGGRDSCVQAILACLVYAVSLKANMYVYVRTYIRMYACVYVCWCAVILIL